MDEGLLRSYLREAVLAELRVDHNFIDRVYRLTGIRIPGGRHGRRLVEPEHDVAAMWLADVEDELGHEIWHGLRSQVHRFVAQRMAGLLKRFNGDSMAAEQTMHNLLNARFGSMRPSRR